MLSSHALSSFHHALACISAACSRNELLGTLDIDLTEVRQVRLPKTHMVQNMNRNLGKVTHCLTVTSRPPRPAVRAALQAPKGDITKTWRLQNVATNWMTSQRCE